MDPCVLSMIKSLLSWYIDASALVPYFDFILSLKIRESSVLSQYNLLSPSEPWNSTSSLNVAIPVTYRLSISTLVNPSILFAQTISHLLSVVPKV